MSPVDNVLTVTGRCIHRTGRDRPDPEDLIQATARLIVFVERVDPLFTVDKTLIKGPQFLAHVRKQVPGRGR